MNIKFVSEERQLRGWTGSSVHYSSVFLHGLPKLTLNALIVILLTLGHLQARQPQDATGLGRPQLVWQGMLKGIHDLVIQNNRVKVEDVSGPPVRQMQYRFVTPLPTDEVTVDVDPRVSRGWVHTVQEPTLANGYILRVRIEDRQSGDYFYSIAITWHTVLQGSNDFAMTRLRGPGKNAAPRDAAWVVDGEREKASLRAIWTGTVKGSARLAISGGEARVIQGQASGNLDMTAGTSRPKGAYLPIAMATSEGTRAKVVDTPTAKNNYTLVIDVLADLPSVNIEIAW